jgi:hypothetical protein
MERLPIHVKHSFQVARRPTASFCGHEPATPEAPAMSSGNVNDNNDYSGHHISPWVVAVSGNEAVD